MALGDEPIEGSHWAAVTPDTKTYAPLAGDVDVDVGVIGAGYTGLVAALTAREGGATVAVLDTQQPGWAASGRNAGHVAPMMWGAKKTPAQIVAKFGPERGWRMNQMIARSGAAFFDMIDRLGITCDAKRGYLCVTRTDKSLDKLAATFAQWEHYGGRSERLSADAVRAHVNASRYAGGVLLPDGGSVNPLALSRGLAAAAERAGVRVLGDSRATHAARDGEAWVVTTPGGRMRCKTLLVGTGAYDDGLFPALNAESYAVACGVLATDPLPDAAPTALAFADIDDGAVFGPTIDARGCLVLSYMIETSSLDAASAERIVRRRLARALPQWRDVPFKRNWAGRFLLSTDGVPHILRLGPNAYAARGCNGLGHTLGFSAAREMALRALGRAESELVLPLTDPKPAPLAGLMPVLLQRVLFPLVNRFGA